MTQEDKKLLLKVLCAMLPYGVSFCTPRGEMYVYGFASIKELFEKGIDAFKPYLRPISSMTKEEKLHVELTYGFCYHDGVLDNTHIFEAGDTYDRDGNYEPPCEYRQEKHVSIEKVLDFIHWLNAHHFDYRGLIPMNLALEAPEGMYDNKEK